MFFGVFLAIATSGAAPSTTCKSLAQDFDANEYAMAMIHDLNESLYQSQRKYVDAMQAADAKYGFYNSPRTRQAEAEAEAKKAEISSDDEKHLAKGDRITTLMMANKCPPPDHVTSWYTYSKSNPNRKEYQRASEGQ